MAIDPNDVGVQDPKLLPEAHLGDGVYISFDGYHVWLAVNHHRNRVVALERGVYENLVRHVRRIWADPK